MKTLQISTAVLLLLFSAKFQAQSWQWGVSGGSDAFGQDNSIDERVRSLQVDGQGNVYTYSYIGGTNATINGVPRQTYNWDNDYEKTDALICSYDCNGVYRWSKVLGGGFDDTIQNMGIDAQGNVYVSVRFFPGFTEYPVSQIHLDTDAVLPMTSAFVATNKESLYLIKYSSQGVLQWYKTFQPSNVSDTETYVNYREHDLQVDPQGNCYWFNALATGVYANGAYTVNNTTDQFTCHVMKYDSAGNFIGGHPLAYKRGGYGASADHSRYYKFKRNHTNGNYYMVGTTDYESVTVGGQTYTAAEISKFVVALSPTGDFLWIRHNNVAPNATYIFDLTFDTDNNIYYSGAGSRTNDFFTPESWNGQPFVATLPNPGGINYFHVLVKMDVNGNTLWQTNSNTASPFVNHSSSSAIRGDEIILGTGLQNFQWQTITNMNMSSNPNTSRTGFIRFNKNTGAIIAANFSDSTVGGGFLGKLAVDSKGNIYGGGPFSQSVSINNNPLYSYGGPNDFFIFKFGSNDCNFLGTTTAEASSILAHPNPVLDDLYLSNKEVLEYELYTALGANIQSGTISIEGKIAFGSLPKGIYLLQTKNEKGEISNHKVIKE